MTKKEKQRKMNKIVGTMLLGYKYIEICHTQCKNELMILRQSKGNSVMVFYHFDLINFKVHCHYTNSFLKDINIKTIEF